MGFLGLLGGAVPWRAVGIGAIALTCGVAVVLILNQAKTIGHLESERAAAIAAATANAAIAEHAHREYARVQAATDAAAVAKIAIRRNADNHRRNITDAPHADDGPLAPVLRRELDRLPEPDRASETH